jgi:methylase of polypeptide subunit release factors
MSTHPVITWTENEVHHETRWRSENGSPPPKRVVIGNDQTSADDAFRWASEGTAILWRGDYQNARQLLTAMARRTDRKPGKAKKTLPTPIEAFNQHRQAQAQRARTLGMLLLPVDDDHQLNLRRAPDIRQACIEAYGKDDQPYVVSMREILGLIGAHEWRKKGVVIPAIGNRVHPHYGVFSPVRGEYLELIGDNELPLPSTALAWDIGTGTGVIAALLARRGVKKVIATDIDPRAIACARDNVARLGVAENVTVEQIDMFPEGRAPLIVCNPPWLPARPSSSIESAIYDPDSRMLLAFLNGLASHLTQGGEGWLILSDLAEHLGLRSREFLLKAIGDAGLFIKGYTEMAPEHPKAHDPTDPLHSARTAEITRLYRLQVR